MAKPKLALIPAAQGDKLYSVLPSSGVGDFDFTRSGGATRINSQGLIETVASGVSRLNYPLIDGVVKGCPSHLLEPSRTNLITYSEDFSQSAWTKLGAGTGSTAIVTSDYSISPDGTQNATRLQCDLNGGLTSSGNQSLIYDAITGTGDTSGFIYVKSNTSSSQNFYLANSLNDFVIGVATTEWQKFELNWVAGGAGRSLSIGTRGTSNSDDVLDLLIWGAQVEQGSYATSYIPTSGSSVTRSAETASNSGDASTFNDSEGVLMAEISALANDGTFKVISINDGGSTTNVVRFYKTTTENQIAIRVTVSSVHQLNVVHTLSDSTANNKMALKYKENDFAFWVNGVEVSTDSSGITFPVGTLIDLSLDDGNGNSPLYGNVKDVRVYNTALNDTELETLTSWVSFSDMAEGQLYTIE